MVVYASLAPLVGVLSGIPKGGGFDFRLGHLRKATDRCSSLITVCFFLFLSNQFFLRLYFCKLTIDNPKLNLKNSIYISIKKYKLSRNKFYSKVKISHTEHYIILMRKKLKNLNKRTYIFC